MTTRRRLPPLFVAAATAAALWSSAAAGPPLICHPVEIGSAPTLPWGRDGASRDYSRESLAADTLRILGSEQSALVHMETLRRATLYIENDRERALELLSRLMARALDGEANGKPDALAWFDAGYLVQCFEQNGLKLDASCGTARGVAGYGWVRRALTLRPDDAELELGAALVTVMAGIPEHQQHLARAKALAKEGTLAAQNLQNPALQQRTHAQREGH